MKPSSIPFFFALIGSPVIAENASNPLAAVNNIDLRVKQLDLGDASLTDGFFDGSHMLRPDIKLKYELHYNWTDTNGEDEQDFESASVKAIWFPSQGQLSETWGYRTAVGLEWGLGLGDVDKGIGTESDQLAPLAGIAFANMSTGTTWVPLVQHFESYNGPTDISTTTARLIVIQPFAEAWWAKADLKLPYDWEADAWPASAELQIGYNVSPAFAVYADALAGLGDDRSFDRGIGVGLRFKY